MAGYISYIDQLLMYTDFSVELGLRRQELQVWVDQQMEKDRKAIGYIDRLIMYSELGYKMGFRFQELQTWVDKQLEREEQAKKERKREELSKAIQAERERLKEGPGESKEEDLALLDKLEIRMLG